MRPIPYLDLRSSGPLSLLTDHADGARALIHASRDAFGWMSRIASAAALPVGDAFSRRWLEKTNNPYFHEIAQAAQLLNLPGVYALNVCYEWGCTSAAYATAEGVTLTRVLDWPFPGLGEHLAIVRLQATAGDYHAATWPGVSGIYQGMAKGRFAVALNQAPMRRHRTGIILDWVRNRFRLWNETALPPSHLLRQVFETARDYAEACRMLSETPVALPVIFTVTGTSSGEGCVIERLERDAAIRPLANGHVAAANHFESHFNGIGHGWMPRAMASHARCLHAGAAPPASVDFDWFTFPVANPLSRLALLADARAGIFTVMGTDGAKPVTEIFRLEHAA